MKNLCILLIVLLFGLSAYAEITQNKPNNLPHGSFRKNRSGQIVQYDKNGKRIGLYKVSNGRYVKLK